MALTGHYLLDFVLKHKIKGWVAAGAQYRNLADTRNVFLPDVSFRFATGPIVTEGSVHEMPDLAVEVESERNPPERMRHKARLYLEDCTPIVWLVFPERKQVEVYTPDDELVLGIGDTLIGGDVLPGFTLAVEAIFIKRGT